MAIRYYPKNRIKPNQYTSGGELLVNGENYVGYYYETYDKKIFTGKDPNDNTGNIPAVRIRNRAEDTLQIRGFDLREDLRREDLRALKSIVPAPTMQDYKRGYFIRYFGKKTDNTESIIEISKENYDRLRQNKTTPEDYLYEVTDLFWKLTGPLNDNRENRQYPIAGIIDTNKRLVETKERTFRGLKAYINENYTKFATPT